MDRTNGKADVSLTRAGSRPVRPDEMDIRHRCFMDGIDWQYHLAGDAGGTELFPSEGSLREKKTCLATGGCGVVEVEVRLIRWVEPQDLTYESRNVPGPQEESDDRMEIRA